MSHKSEYKHHDEKHAHDQRRGKRPWWRQPHKDWRVYVAVALMLLAMFAYVATFDEALVPGNPGKQPVPAATGP
ncbi:MAG TPA: hypothetical protein VND64_20900 [Pirellulales bacterium]|nr:hypothetical protein [Pirellulales bacterium]